jgi:hypothetical protein
MVNVDVADFCRFPLGVADSATTNNSKAGIDMFCLSKVHWPILLASAVSLCSVSQCAHAQEAGAANSASRERSLSVHEFRDDAFREMNYRDPRFLDSRYHVEDGRIKLSNADRGDRQHKVIITLSI